MCPPFCTMNQKATRSIYLVHNGNENMRCHALALFSSSWSFSRAFKLASSQTKSYARYGSQFHLPCFHAVTSLVQCRRYQWQRHGTMRLASSLLNGDRFTISVDHVQSESPSNNIDRRKELHGLIGDETNHHDGNTTSCSNAINRSSQNDTDIINGTSDGLVIKKLYHVPLQGFANQPDDTSNQNESFAIPSIQQIFTSQDLNRLEITSTNVTLPAALLLLDPKTYPTQSRARKAIRRKSICFSRHNTNNSFELGKVLTRIYPGDTIGLQHRQGNDYYASNGDVYRKPSFDIPVLYEDDHMAIINKPAGIVLYRAQGGRGGGNRGHGRDTLLSALPYVLTPSNVDDRLLDAGFVPLKRPHPVHRLDRPTSGLVVVAKTKYAAVHLSEQFEFRKVKKRYTAIVNGYPSVGDDDEEEWNVIDYDLDGKSAVTEWRVVKTVKSLVGAGGVLTLVEMRPRTGRYHQLRRHFAWVCNTPLVGDSTYDNGDTNALRLRQRGLFLCSNGIELEHPFYNTPIGEKDWVDDLESDCLYRDKESGRVMINAKIDLPDKFQSFLYHENRRAEKFK